MKGGRGQRKKVEREKEGKKKEGWPGRGQEGGRGGDADNKKNGWRKEKELKERVVGKVLVHWWGKQ